MRIFEIIKELCEERNIKISVLERDLEFSRGSIYKMAESAPGADKLRKLADYFNVSTDYLVGRTSNKEGYFDYSMGEMTYDMLLKFYANNKDNFTSEDKLKFAQEILSDINSNK
jgi:transcriptional regulator with XRE-family HTH domain